MSCSSPIPIGSGSCSQLLKVRPRNEKAIIHREEIYFEEKKEKKRDELLFFIKLNL